MKAGEIGLRHLNDKREQAMTVPIIKSFREFANEMRQPSPYRPLITELKGLTNLGLGSMQLLVGQYMKYSKSSYLNQLSARHVQIGNEAIYRGLVQFMPGFLVSISAMSLIRRWDST